MAIPYATKRELDCVNNSINKKQNKLEAGKNITISEDNVISAIGGGELPVASTTVLGGVKIGENLNMADDGTISVPSEQIIEANTAEVIPEDAPLLTNIKTNNQIYSLPTATLEISDVKPAHAAPAHIIKINNDVYSFMNPATANKLGGIKIGKNLTVDNDGTLNVTSADELIIHSPNNTAYKITVDDNGNLTTTKVIE